MREFKKRRGPEERLALFAGKALGALALFVVAIYIVHGAVSMYGKMVEASTGQEEAENQLANLEAQQQDISKTLDHISTQQGQEAQMRELYGFAKPGEGEIDIVEDPHVPTTTPQQPESWWQRLFKAFKVW